MVTDYFPKKLLVAAILVLMAGAAVLLGLPSSHVVGVLEIDVINIVTYIGDTADYSKLASVPSLTTVAPKSFAPLTGVGDIVMVNGKPARGTWSVFTALNLLAPIQAPGIAFSDTFRGGVAVTTMEILNPDFSPRGTLMAMGLAGGQAPPAGGAFGLKFGNMAIVGGTGEFIGAKGVMGETSNPLEGFRFASASEDPSVRRTLGGGKLTFVFSMSN
jgi:hypothetical protein